MFIWSVSEHCPALYQEIQSLHSVVAAPPGPRVGVGGVGPPLCAGRLILDGTFKSSSRGAGCRVGIQREKEKGKKQERKEGSYGKSITWLCRRP